ncbi:cytochrome P450 [Microbacterium murale]|uniref:Cytochrome P450 n=1 Tax=Microbacterium murale TaxID=1081040 RepID=A0ABQ1RCB7_9MICO|nr:cytochrome P450 [Microbacterium murale]GGD65727.1 cytochrome P450 [Microbacterium murale]
MTTLPATVQHSDLDPFAPEFTHDPFEGYRQWRELGRVMQLPAHETWVLPGYEDVRAALADDQTFSTARGTGLLEESHTSSVISSDRQRHPVLRSVLSSKTSPRAMAAVRDDIFAQVDALVAHAVDRGSLDAVTDIAEVIPVSVVADLIGLPEDDREPLLPGADVVNRLFGPLTPELAERLPEAGHYFGWMAAKCDRSILRSGSWGSAILDAVDDGLIEHEEGVWLMNGYLVAGMDTTVNALSSLLHLFATRPEAWERIVADPSLAAGAFEEIVRLESPIQGFFRVTTRDVAYDEFVLPAGERVLLSFGSANRDDRHFPGAALFRPERRPIDHVGFGFGAHGCAGQALARLEAAALMTSLLKRVDRIELIGDPVRRSHPVVRGMSALPVRLHAR